MSEIFNLIIDQINVIEKYNGAQVIIDNCYSFLSNTKLTQLPSYNRWHLSDYCKTVKENQKIFKYCWKLKRIFRKRIFENDEIKKSTCFCGVEEYFSPITINGFNICFISVTGLKGDFSQKRINNLAKRLGTDPKELERLRDTVLLKDYDNETLEAHIKMLSFLVKEYIIRETNILETLGEKNKISNKYVLNALDYIEGNFTRDITVADIAKECFISVSYLQNLFSKTIGHSIVDEIRDRRIAYAKELLCSTDYSVKYIAFECGFESSEYFSVVFKKYCKITPLKFRKENKQNPT